MAEETRRASLTPEQRQAEDEAKRQAEAARRTEEAVRVEAKRVAEAEREARAKAERDEEEKEGREWEAEATAQQLVKVCLKHPDDAEFNPTGTDHHAGRTKPINGQRHWVVQGKVKAPNDFGAKLTHSYLVQLYHVSDDVWMPVCVKIDGKQVFWRDPTASKSTTRKPTEPEWRIWTSGKGRHYTEARFIKYEKKLVHLEKRDGKVMTMLLHSLSDTDQQYVLGRVGGRE